MTDPDHEPDRWRSLFKTFSLEHRSAVPVPPAVADLDRFEAETGIRLPAGFRGYLRVFGPGCLLVGGGRNCREMFISSPYSPDSHLNLGRATDRLRSLRDDPPRGMDERVRRLVVFATNGFGHEFGWDPQELTDDAPEFAVYAWYRGDNAVRVSRTFSGFIKFTLDLAARTDHALHPVDRDGADEAEFGPPDPRVKRVFQPATAD